VTLDTVNSLELTVRSAHRIQSTQRNTLPLPFSPHKKHQNNATGPSATKYGTESGKPSLIENTKTSKND